MTSPPDPTPFPIISPDPPDVPAEEVLRVARLVTTHRVEVHQEFETGGPVSEVWIFDLSESERRGEINRVSDALLDFCMDNNWLAAFYVTSAPEWIRSTPQG